MSCMLRGMVQAWRETDVDLGRQIQKDVVHGGVYIAGKHVDWRSHVALWRRKSFALRSGVRAGPAVQDACQDPRAVMHPPPLSFPMYPPPLSFPTPCRSPGGGWGTITWSTQNFSLQLIVLLCG